jgi:hypothetical protein
MQKYTILNFIYTFLVFLNECIAHVGISRTLNKY